MKSPNSGYLEAGQSLEFVVGASAFASDKFARRVSQANALNSHASCRESAPQSGPPILATCQLTSGSPALAFGMPETARRLSCSFIRRAAGPPRARTGDDEQLFMIRPRAMCATSVDRATPSRTSRSHSETVDSRRCRQICSDSSKNTNLLVAVIVTTTVCAGARRPIADRVRWP